MFLEPVFTLQQKYNKGVLSRILNKSKKKELILRKIKESALKDDFFALYIISLNRSFFEEDLVSINDFKLNAISEIISIMSIGEGDTEFQNQVINYLMQVKDQDFLIYVLDNILGKRKHFPVRNIMVFITTLTMELKSSKLNSKQKRNLKDVINRHFSGIEEEIKEPLTRMMEVLKITDI